MMTDKHRILVVGDERTVAETISLVLQRSGYVSQVAYDGEQAIALAREFHPHLIVADVVMPKLDGFGVLAATRSLPDPPKVLLLSGNAAISNRLEMEEEKGFPIRLLTKPVPPPELLATVRSILESEAA
jgi:CheY-like chemotaxis protein